jgi:hypothetical protein
MNKKKILIAGDSWGCGEWDFRNGILTNTHRGLQQFLEWGNTDVCDNHLNYVENISKGASSNVNTLNELQKINDITKYDYVIVFVTDYFRDFILTPHFNNKINDGTIPFDAVSSKQKLLSVYREFEIYFINKLSKLKNNNIILLGGLSKVNSNLLLDYDNLKSPIPSIIEFLLPDLYQHNIFVEKLLPNIPDNIEPNYLDFLNEEYNKWETASHGLFFLLDRNHPDRNGHLLIYNKLKKELNINF